MSDATLLDVLAHVRAGNDDPLFLDADGSVLFVSDVDGCTSAFAPTRPRRRPR